MSSALTVINSPMPPLMYPLQPSIFEYRNFFQDKRQKIKVLLYIVDRIKNKWYKYLVKKTNKNIIKNILSTQNIYLSIKKFKNKYSLNWWDIYTYEAKFIKFYAYFLNKYI